MKEHTSDWRGTVLYLELWMGALVVVAWCLSELGKVEKDIGLIVTLIIVATLMLVGAVFVQEREKRRQTAWIMFALGIISLCGGALAVPILRSAQSSSTRAACLSNVRQLALAMCIYAADYDDKLPPAEAWRNGVWPYSYYDFRCPDSTAVGTYAMNERLGQRNPEELADPSRSVLVFEVECNVLNAHGGMEWLVMRHKGTAAISFADAHAKAFSRVQAESLIWVPTLKQPNDIGSK